MNPSCLVIHDLDDHGSPHRTDDGDDRIHDRESSGRSGLLVGTHGMSRESMEIQVDDHKNPCNTDGGEEDGGYQNFHQMILHRRIHSEDHDA